MTLPAWLAAHAAAAPASTALIDAGRPVSYGALDVLVTKAANVLAAHGVVAGDRVAIALDNSTTMVAVYLGAMRAGAVAVPLPPGPRSDRLPAVVADCAPRVAIVDAPTLQSDAARAALSLVPAVIVAGPEEGGEADALATALDNAPESPLGGAADERALAAIIYTSGSTGEPRGVMLSHRNFVTNAQAIIASLALTASDRVLCVLPFSYVYGLSLLHTHLAVGGTVVLENRSAFPNVVLAAMAEHAVTGFAGVPSTFALMLHRSNLATTSLPALRYVTQAGGAMSPAKIDEWRARGPQAAFFVMYGATEAAARLTCLAPADLDRKRGSIGRPIQGVEIRVMTDAGHVATPGEVGELVAQGPNVSAGYWRRPDETAARFGPDGYKTGDLGFADDEGYLYIVGRRHDMIKVGANRVGAREIEDVLQAHPAVNEAAVIAAADELLGEVPVAFVSLREPLEDAARTLRGFAAARLVAYKVPTRVVVLSDLPKLPGAGKLDRQALRSRATSGEVAP